MRLRKRLTNMNPCYVSSRCNFRLSLLEIVRLQEQKAYIAAEYATRM